MQYKTVQGSAAKHPHLHHEDDHIKPPPPDASIQDRISYLHRQLDGMHVAKKPIMGIYEVLPHSSRRQGGLISFTNLHHGHDNVHVT